MPQQAPMAQATQLSALSGAMTREAFQALKRWTGGSARERAQRHANIRELPLLIRRHGLRCTLHHWLAEGGGDEQQHVEVARAFASALDAVAPGLPSLVGSTGAAAHMLQTRLALELADQWLALSEAMLTDEGSGAATGTAWTQGRPSAPPPLPALQPQHRNAAFELFHVPYPANGNAQVQAGPSLQISSELSAKHFDRVCETSIGPDSPYRVAFDRWKAGCVAAGTHHRELAFEHRLLIGLSEPSLWETCISLDPVYGTPTIAGSALKGLAAHFARDHLCGNQGPMTEALCNLVYGTAECGGLVDFLDAWWVPDSAPSAPGAGPASTSRPLVREVVTPHHQESQDRESPTMATPFDKPVPVAQLAAHGKFLFAVHGPAIWAAHALDILQVALETEGVGARTPEYGRVQRAEAGTAH